MEEHGGSPNFEPLPITPLEQPHTSNTHSKVVSQ